MNRNGRVNRDHSGFGQFPPARLLLPGALPYLGPRYQLIEHTPGARSH